MENLSSLTDQELEAGLQQLICAETETLHDVLVDIREVDARRLYLRRARPSLFEYLVEERRYSSSAAQRRIDASRLSNEIPGLLGKIRERRLNLHQIGVLQRGVRLKEKDEPVPTEKKMEILAWLELAPFREIESIVVKELGLKSLARESAGGQADGSVRLSISMTKKEWAKLERCREVLSHAIPTGNISAVIEKICSFYLAKKKRERGAAAESWIQEPNATADRCRCTSFGVR